MTRSHFPIATVHVTITRRYRNARVAMEPYASVQDSAKLVLKRAWNAEKKAHVIQVQ